MYTAHGPPAPWGSPLPKGCRPTDAARWIDLWWWRFAFREYGSAWPLRSVLLGSFRQSRLAKGIGEALHPFRCRDIARDHPAHREFRLQL